MKSKKMFHVLAMAVALVFLGAAGVMAQIEICGDAQVSTLWGGKTINVGTVTVSNDEDNIYVTYQTSGDWWLKEVQLYVLDYEPTQRLQPGQAPYKQEYTSPYVKSHTFTVPLSDLNFTVTCDETALWLQAHATVVKIFEGQEVQSETAYPGTIVDPQNGSWYGNVNYVIQCCDGEVCYEFMDETAWAAGTRYVSKGNWATFTPYVSGQTVTLYAGKTINVGTVTFSAPDNGFVTITINLSGDWEFADVEENVKIQDYIQAPSGNPSPGQFDWKGTASGQSFNIDVPVNNFYGVHADVGYWMEVECPPVE